MEYLTLNQIIEKTGKSRSTIKRIIKDYQIEADGKYGKANVYGDETVLRIEELLLNPGHLVVSSGSKEEPEIELFEPENELYRPEEKPEKEPVEPEKEPEPETVWGNKETYIKEDYIAFLKSQIEEKDKEISQLHQLLSQSQQLQLVTQQKVRELEASVKANVPDSRREGEETQKTVEKPAKVSFWKRLFR